jgi:hypothetical protein
VQVACFLSLWLNGLELSGTFGAAPSATGSPIRVLRLGCAMQEQLRLLLLPELRWLWLDKATTSSSLHLHAPKVCHIGPVQSGFKRDCSGMTRALVQHF